MPKFNHKISSTEKYQKAKMDLIQAFISIEELTPNQKECLIREVVIASNIAVIYNVLKKLTL